MSMPARQRAAAGARLLPWELAPSSMPSLPPLRLLRLIAAACTVPVDPGGPYAQAIAALAVNPRRPSKRAA